MSRGRVGYVVQETDSHLFLCSIDGDVGYTRLLSEADPFDDIQEAIDTATLLVGAPFQVTAVWIPTAN